MDWLFSWTIFFQKSEVVEQPYITSPWKTFWVKFFVLILKSVKSGWLMNKKEKKCPDTWRNPEVFWRNLPRNPGWKTLPYTMKIKDLLIIILLYLLSISWPLYVASRYCNLLTCRDGAIRHREIRIRKNISNAFQSLSLTQLMVVSINKCA